MEDGVYKVGNIGVCFAYARVLVVMTRESISTYLHMSLDKIDKIEKSVDFSDIDFEDLMKVYYMMNELRRNNTLSDEIHKVSHKVMMQANKVIVEYINNTVNNLDDFDKPRTLS